MSVITVRIGSVSRRSWESAVRSLKAYSCSGLLSGRSSNSAFARLSLESSSH